MVKLFLGIVNADMALLAVLSVVYANSFSWSSTKKSKIVLKGGSKRSISR